jgi:ABC-type transport system substrate-binding protein
VKRLPIKISLFFAVIAAFGVNNAPGQQPFDSALRRTNAQNLVIGLLTGQSDYREVSITTREGTFRVYGQGNSRPFELLEATPERLVIAFKPPGAETAAGSDVRRPQKIIYQFFRTERSLISAMILDEVDYALFESEAVAAEIANTTRNFRILPLPAPASFLEMICYNLKHPILRERAVRQALSYSIRRQDLERRFFAMTGADIGVGPFSKENRYNPPGANDYSYNPKRAVELLRAAGWLETNRDGVLVRNGEPLSFRIFYDQSTQLKEDIIRQIKISWNEINVNVIPIPLSFSEIQERLRHGDYDAVLLHHLFDETLAGLEDFFNPGFLNYDSPSLQKAFSNAKKYQGTAAFRANLQHILLMINRDQPVSFLYHPWQTWHAINLGKFENFIDRGGKLKPYYEWQLRLQP